MEAKEDRIARKLYGVAVHEAGHIVALLSFHVMPYRVVLESENRGRTYYNRRPSWTQDDEDYVSLAGTVAEHMANGTFAGTLEVVKMGLTPRGASSDFDKLSMTDNDLIADTMLYIHDFFCNERWGIVLEYASELLEKRILLQSDIERIADKLCGGERDIGRIARIRQRRHYLTAEELLDTEPI
jgi:hypothetical protein